MRILVIAPQPFFQQRGTPIAVRLLVESLAKLGHDIDLLCYHFGEDVELPRTRVIRSFPVPGIDNLAPGPSLKKILCDLSLCVKCIQLLRRNDYDIIHAVEEGAFIALAIKSTNQVPFVYDMDSSMADQIVEKYPFLRFVLPFLTLVEGTPMRHCSGILAVCKALEHKARSQAPGARVQRLEDISLLDKSGSAESLRSAHGIEGPIIMYVGNLEKYQGIDLLLEGFREIGSKNTMNEAPSLVVIGGDSESVAAYQEKAAILEIDSRTFFLGPRPIEKLYAYLRQADIVVSPRIKGKNTPMKVYSYLDSGVPLLATRLLTHTQVMDESIAWLAEPTSKGIADGIEALLASPELRNQLAVAAREQVEREHSVPAFSRKVEAFFKAIEQTIHPGITRVI